MELITWILIGLLLLAAVFLPRFGLRAALNRRRARQERERVEDALKHLLERQREGRHASPESLSGVLGLNRARAAALIESMETQGLLETRGAALQLTPDGERWGLHVVRAHRLWERFLVDEARMPLNQIHVEAHRREHHLSEAQLNELDAALGYPTRDPHGDPIPNRVGSLPESKATPLTAWPTNEFGQVVHLEDEPAIAFEQLLAAGLKLGQTLRILERTRERIVLSDGEHEYRLAPAVASNVHLAALPEEQLLRQEALPLSEVEHNQRAEIVLLDHAVQGFTRRRFLDLGLTPGTRVYPELQNSFGDPRGYRVRGTLIALRKEQAEKVLVRLVAPRPAPTHGLTPRETQST
jgi:DtxR family Mn-dependent transcriptional regulator